MVGFLLKSLCIRKIIVSFAAYFSTLDDFPSHEGGCFCALYGNVVAVSVLCVKKEKAINI